MAWTACFFPVISLCNTTIAGKNKAGFSRPKLPTDCESEFRDMNQFSGIGIVSLEFRVLVILDGRGRDGGG
jgi:hypothetical protein